MIAFHLTERGKETGYRLEDVAGLIPFFMSAEDERPAREQIDENYVGGWRPQSGYKLLEGNALKYPDDPPLYPLAEGSLRDERILVYFYGITAIVQPDGAFEVSRLD